MEFLTFHVDLGASATAHPNQTLQHQAYISMIDMMFSSAQLFHPAIKRTILTDRRTDLAGLTTPARRIDSMMDYKQLMLERTELQLRYVLASEFTVPLVLLDSDVLINRSLTELMQRDFDVALTWRDNPVMPINGGVFILNNQRPERSKAFFENFAKIYREKYADKAEWFGDQLALRDCINLSHKEMEGLDVIDVNGSRVLLLPSDIYNFSPENQFKAIAKRLEDKVILHFKGERKRLMPIFWKAWLKPRQSCSPWTKFEGWKTRRWLRREVRKNSSFSTY